MNETDPRQRATFKFWLHIGDPAGQSAQMFKMKWGALVLGAIAAVSAVRGADAELARFAAVDVGPVSTWAYLANIKLSVDRFQRQGDTYTAPYSANVFPFIFFSEKGTLRIKVPDEALRELAKGEAFDFTGTAVRTDGKERAVNGRATPTDSATGRLKVRLFYSPRIVVTFNTTYSLPAAAAAPRAAAKAQSQ